MHHPCSFIRIDRMSVINRNWRFTPIAGSEFQSILRHSHSLPPPNRSSLSMPSVEIHVQLVTSIIENYQSGLGLTIRLWNIQVINTGSTHYKFTLMTCFCGQANREREIEQAGGICWIAMNAHCSVAFFFVFLIQMGTWGCLHLVRDVSTVVENEDWSWKKCWREKYSCDDSFCR